MNCTPYLEVRVLGCGLPTYLYVYAGLFEPYGPAPNFSFQIGLFYGFKFEPKLKTRSIKHFGFPFLLKFIRVAETHRCSVAFTKYYKVMGLRCSCFAAEYKKRTHINNQFRFYLTTSHYLCHKLYY